MIDLSDHVLAEVLKLIAYKNYSLARNEGLFNLYKILNCLHALHKK